MMHALMHVQFGYSHGFMDQMYNFQVGNIGLKNKNLPRKELKQKKVNNKKMLFVINNKEIPQ